MSKGQGEIMKEFIEENFLSGKKIPKNHPIFGQGPTLSEKEIEELKQGMDPELYKKWKYGEWTMPGNHPKKEEEWTGVHSPCCNNLNPGCLEKDFSIFGSKGGGKTFKMAMEKVKRIEIESPGKLTCEEAVKKIQEILDGSDD
jgi:hypothetical protein